MNKDAKKIDYKAAAESMAVHIQGVLYSLQPDENGKHSPMSAEEVEIMWLFSRVCTKMITVAPVFKCLGSQD